jgi:NAD(P)-dependent dehydrogenase (short-subunit alcohol dehydrogenase family)
VGLSAEQQAFFEQNGYVGPFKLADAALVEPLTEILTGKARAFPELRGQKPLTRRLLDAIPRVFPFVRLPFSLGTRTFYKSAHILLPEAARLGSSPAIVERVQSVLGGNLALWGAQVITQAPGKKHRWHQDIEHTAWNGITAWVALANVTPQSTLKVIRGSHRFTTAPQDLQLNGDTAAVQAAQRMNPDAELVTLKIKPGEFVLFAGKTWHATANDTENDRTSLLLQYCDAAARVRIPVRFEKPAAWSFFRPPVLRIGRAQRAQTQRLAGKVTVVTGGSRGIGLAIASELAAQGASVAILSRNSVENAAACAALTKLYGAKTLSLPTDVSNTSAVARAFRTIEERLGAVDMLVNNAGTFNVLSPVAKTNAAAWLREVQTNLGGAFLCSTACLPSMLRRNRGTIVNVIGGGAGYPIPHGTAYASSKAALARFTESLAAELHGTSIAVFGVDPGFVRTRMTLANARSENGQRWRPQIGNALARKSDVSPHHAARLVATLATGKYRALAGRVLFSAGSSAQLRYQKQFRDRLRAALARAKKILIN